MSVRSSGLRGTLLTQAAITAVFSFLPGNGMGSTWLVAQLALAAAAAVVAWYVGTGARQAYPAALAFEGVALAAGVIGLTGGRYIPGTIIGIGALVRLLSGKEAALPQPVPAEAMDAAETAPATPIEAAVPFVPPPPLVAAGSVPAPAFAEAGFAAGSAPMRPEPVQAVVPSALETPVASVLAAPAAMALPPQFTPVQPEAGPAPAPVAPAPATPDYGQRMPLHSELTELATAVPEPVEAPEEPATPARYVVPPGRMALDVLPGKGAKRGRR
jgi:2-oxoglutarate dehydrogenase E2 component (dihydrolipoamide succinyltransferase)